MPDYESRGAATVSSQSQPSQPVTAVAVPLGEIVAHSQGAVGVAYSDDGRTLVTAGGDATLKVWNAQRRTLDRTIRLDDGPPLAMAVMQRRALTGHANGRTVLWDIDTAEKLGVYQRNEASIWAVAFAGSPDRFATASHDWMVTLWDERTKSAPAHTFQNHENSVQALAYARQTGALASGGADRTVRLWNLETLDQTRAYRGHKDFVTALAFSPEGRMLAAATLDGGIRLWSAGSARLQRVLKGHQGRITALAYSPAGDYLASAGDDGTVRLWELRQRGRAVRAFGGHAGGARSVAFAPNGHEIATAGADGVIRLWSAPLQPIARE